jgi:2-polyprenyl-6-methoxyphenol hydroxylase-like FAD-dependent oxidoreductase
LEAINKILVVGGGVAGMAAAIRFRQAGVAVDLVERDPEWQALGAGITITGPTLRAYRRLGLLDEIRARGAVTNGHIVRHFTGAILNDLDEPVLEGGLPATGGILRPILHEIMSSEVKRLGVSVRLGTTVEALETLPGVGVDATFADGPSGRYDLLIGADGIFSHVRSLAFPHAIAPAYTGQGCWRMLANRPEGLTKGEFYVGHEYMAGITACSADMVYVFLMENSAVKARYEDDQLLEKMRSLLADFGGNIATIREAMGPQSAVNFRPLEGGLQPRPWRNERILLIGDAAHATTPHLASGAGLAVEDALVLVEELEKGGRTVEDALDAYLERRFERCRFVVETSLAIGRAQIAGHTDEVGKMSGEALHRMAEEI